MAIRTVIVDDEPHARALLRRMLAAHADVEVVAEYGGGAEALRGLAGDRAALALVDIQMPGMDGLRLAEAVLDTDDPPSLVFVTAFDEFAVRAFEVHALDYLLKPVDPARLGHALARVRAARAAPAGQVERLRGILDALAGAQRRAARLPVRVGERTFFLVMDEIERVEADGKHVRIHAGGKAYTVRETLQRMQARLEEFRFLRVSRSAIVNLDRVREVQPWFRGDLVVIMESGAQVTTTRGFRDALRELIDPPG